MLEWTWELAYFYKVRGDKEIKLYTFCTTGHYPDIIKVYDTLL